MAAKIINRVVELSGLPEDYARLRLRDLLQEGGFDPEDAGLDEIRDVLSSLLQDLILATETETQ